MRQKKKESATPDTPSIGSKLAIVAASCLAELSDDAAMELGRGLATLLKRFSWATQGSFTPESGLFDTFMLAAFQNRDPETVRRWCEDREITLRKTGRPNSYKGSEVIEAARGADDGEGAAGKK